VTEAVAAAAEGAAGAVALLSANPIHDTGGGQRSAQVALELLERDFAVLFVSHGRVTETVDLDLRYDHPRLVQAPLRALARRDALEATAPFWHRGVAAVLTQVPVRAWLPILDAARAGGAVEIYDCIDRWDSELGRGWYDAAAEREIARRADVLVASAPALVEHVERLAGREALLLPNAYNARLFDGRGGPFPRPADLPEAPRTALYVGALWGGWMDWGLVDRLARAHPTTSFVFVGDHRREGRGLPDNCAFLGLKPQRELPAYLASADLAFLPWSDDDVTRATSPLKVYEFVAMGLPVVAPDIEPLRGIPGVRSCRNRAGFVEAIGTVGRDRLDREARVEMERFAEGSSWGARVDALLEAVGRTSRTDATGGAEPGPRGNRRAPPAHTGATISVVVPSYNHERYLGAAMDGVHAQTLPASELVIVDDGSTDASREVIERHRFPGVRPLFQDNRGAHRALNRAIALARGEWIAILNSDDVFEPWRLEHAWGVARATGAALICGSVRLIGEDGEAADPAHPIARWYGEALDHARSTPSLRAAIRRHNVAVTSSNYFLHREVWSALGGFAPYRYTHDYDFLLRALALCPDRVRWVEELTGVLYRVHGANTISESEERARGERRETLRAFRSPTARLRRLALRARRGRSVGRAVERDAALDPLGAPVGSGVGEASRPDAAGSVEAGAGSGPSPTRRAGEAVRSPSTTVPRVGLVVSSLDVGGLEEVVALLAQSLPTLGAPTSVLCTHSGGVVAERLRRVGVPVRVAGGRLNEWRTWAREERPDVVSSHFARREVVEALAGEGLPIVETVHNVYAWLRSDDWEQERTKQERLSAVIAVSRTVADYWEKRTGRTPDHVVSNGVHPGRAATVPRAFARRTLGVARDVPLFVSVGRLAVQKNPDGLLAAFERVREETPDACLLLVGSADRSVPMASLRRRYRKLFRGGAVRWLGSVADVGTVLCAADAFVSASFHEGWSVAASEAAWVGRPLVLTDTGGSLELAGADGERGIVVPNPCGDPLTASPRTIVDPPTRAAAASEEALADAMLAVAGSRRAWAGRADEIRAHARVALSPRTFAARYLEVLRSAAHGEHAPNPSNSVLY
jgi:glycosyltransferase involved in cell wall biosynthesis